MQNQIISMLYQLIGMSSESLQEQSLHSSYSKEQAELLAQAPGINMLTSSQNTIHICEGCFHTSALKGEVAAWHVVVLPSQEAYCASQGTPCGSRAPRGDMHHVPKASADGKDVTCCAQRKDCCIPCLCCADYAVTCGCPQAKALHSLCASPRNKLPSQAQHEEPLPLGTADNRELEAVA